MRVLDKDGWIRSHVVEEVGETTKMDKTLCGYFPVKPYKVTEMPIKQVIYLRFLCRGCMQSLGWFASEELEASGLREALNQRIEKEIGSARL